MLPATVQFFIAMIASALTDRLTRKMDYMREEQRILMELLHQATGKKRIAWCPQTHRDYFRMNSRRSAVLKTRPTHAILDAFHASRAVRSCIAKIIS